MAESLKTNAAPAAANVAINTCFIADLLSPTWIQEMRRRDLPNFRHLRRSRANASLHALEFGHLPAADTGTKRAITLSREDSAMPRFSKVLCPVDFSDYSEAALRHAARLASRSGDTLIVMAVTDPLLAFAAETRYRNIDVGTTTAADLREFFNRVVPATKVRRQVRYLITAGSPGSEIVKAAKRLRVDVIVIGTRGLGGVRRLMIGSTTDYVLRHASTPVLALPAAWTAAHKRAAAA
jgi:nucleotide-binding universal stress UspA family protein